MKYLFFIFLLSLSATVYSQTEMKYNAKSENLSNWAELMYSESPDEGEVIKLYREYYKTNEFVKLAGKKSKICCTRKTIPNLRVIQKYAVKLGGGINHRFNLSDE